MHLTHARPSADRSYLGELPAIDPEDITSTARAHHNRAVWASRACTRISDAEIRPGFVTRIFQRPLPTFKTNSNMLRPCSISQISPLVRTIIPLRATFHFSRVSPLDRPIRYPVMRGNEQLLLE